MWSRRRESMFALRKERFAEPFYTRHRAHITWGPNGCGVVWLVGSGTVVMVNLTALVAGWKFQMGIGWLDWVGAGVAVIFFLLIVAAVRAGIRDQFQVAVLPYFERQVGDIDTFLAGEALIWHSRELDEVAARCGVTPLSAFASGDDLIRGEQVCWFEAAEGLRTTERLLEPDVAGTLPAGVVTDLERLRDALRRASAQGIRFGLLVREGSYASGHEMSLRRGSFF